MEVLSCLVCGRERKGAVTRVERQEGKAEAGSTVHGSLGLQTPTTHPPHINTRNAQGGGMSTKMQPVSICLRPPHEIHITQRRNHAGKVPQRHHTAAAACRRWRVYDGRRGTRQPRVKCQLRAPGRSAGRRPPTTGAEYNSAQHAIRQRWRHHKREPAKQTATGRC